MEKILELLKEWSGLAPWLSAIGSILASLVALYLGLRKNKPEIQFKVDQEESEGNIVKINVFNYSPYNVILKFNKEKQLEITGLSAGGLLEIPPIGNQTVSGYTVLETLETKKYINDNVSSIDLKVSSNIRYKLCIRELYSKKKYKVFLRYDFSEERWKIWQNKR